MESKQQSEVMDSPNRKAEAKADRLSKANLQRFLGAGASHFALEVYDSLPSTSSVLKERAESLPEWTVILAEQQTAGRGRIGHRFHSPAGTGVYLSVLLRSGLLTEEATRITTTAAVAACRAIEGCTNAEPKIKWVNDVFVDGKKVCGILTEGSLNQESSGFAWAVMGIGFNVYEPEGGFPESLQGVAGAIAKKRQKDLRSQIAAAFLRQFYGLCANLDGTDIAEEYKRRSFLIGREVTVNRGSASRPAEVLDIDGDCRLLVRYRDGTREELSSGEVSVRI